MPAGYGSADSGICPRRSTASRSGPLKARLPRKVSERNRGSWIRQRCRRVDSRRPRPHYPNTSESITVPETSREIVPHRTPVCDSPGLRLVRAGDDGLRPPWPAKPIWPFPISSLGNFTIAGQTIDAWHLLFYGSFVIVGTLGISLFLRSQIKNLPAHESMLDISEIIFQTCKTYLIQQGKFLLMLFAIISGGHDVLLRRACKHKSVSTRASPCWLFAIVGMGGSYWVAWYGIRVNTYANSPHRLCLAKRRTVGRRQHSAAGRHVGRPVPDLARTGHDGHHPAVRRSRRSSAICFLGFAIGESLGASALRIAGGIFTKIADIGSDLMKIVFNVKEDDPRNPGVIADCTGDNAGDSVGPTADGFETYGVTGVALISFIVLAIPEAADPTCKPS